VTHWNYYLGMLTEGVPENTACAQYLAVRIYKTWDVDQNGRPINIEILGTNIADQDAGKAARAWAAIKATIGGAVRTREYTNNEFLTVFPDGAVPATREGVEEYVERLRDALADETYITSPESLGLMTDENFTNFEQLAPWPKDFIEPRLDPTVRPNLGFIYFDPSIAFQESALVQALDLTLPPATIYKVPTEDTIDIQGLSLEANRIFQEFLSLESSPLPSEFGSDAIQAAPLEGVPGISYQVSPSLQDYLMEEANRPVIGSGGTLLLQERLDGGQELLIQPSPMR
jgi:hypothetical protein